MLKRPSRTVVFRSTVLGLLIVGGLGLLAQEAALEIDPAQTEVDYTVDSTLHTVRGKFRLKRGDVRFDPATGAAEGELVVDARSGDSGSHARDQKMNKDVLESERFGEIVFRPHRVEGKVAREGPSQVLIHGTFSIHGGDHEITVPAGVEAAGGQFTVTAHFDVPYVKWGMKNPGNFLLHVNDKVGITVRTVAKTRGESSRAER